MDTRNPHHDFFERYRFPEGSISPRSSPNCQGSGTSKSNHTLGEGGQGSVIVYFDSVLGKNVRLKVPSESSDALALYFFVTEALVETQLQHPGIPPVFDIGYRPREEDEDTSDLGYRTPGGPYIATEYLPNAIPFHTWLKNNRAEPYANIVSDAVNFFLEVCRVVDFAHESGIIHRDLKPSNILVEGASVRVIDWGSAFVHPLDDKERMRLKKARIALAERMGIERWESKGSAPGTPPYSDPTLARDMDPDRRADIYSLGVMLNHILTKQEWIASESTREPRSAGQANPSGLHPELRRDLLAIAEKAAAIPRGNRYATAGELAEDIQRALRREVVVARPHSAWLKSKKWISRKPGGALAVVLALVALSSALAAVMFHRTNRANDRERLYQIARRMAQEGKWAEAIDFWNKADSAGYPDKVELALRRIEARTILSQSAQSRQELNRLEQRADLGNRRGEVLLRLGEHQLFDKSATDHAQAVSNILTSLELQLPFADRAVANGLIATSSSAALSNMLQALLVEPGHHAANRHALGLYFLSGNHEALRGRLEIFRSLYNHDPSAAILLAASFALRGDTNAALGALKEFRNRAGDSVVSRFSLVLPHFAAISDFFDPSLSIEHGRGDFARLETLRNHLNREGRELFVDGPITAHRIPHLPCLETGIHHFSAILGGFLNQSIGVEHFVDTTKRSWRAYPDSLLPAIAAIALEGRSNPNQKETFISRNQLELFAMAAESTNSIIPNAPRFARVRACQEALYLLEVKTNVDAASVRKQCADLLRGASADRLTVKEARFFATISTQLEQHTLAKSFIDRWLTLESGQRAPIEVSIENAIARGDFMQALKQLNNLRISMPDDPWASKTRTKVISALENTVRAEKTLL